MKKKNNQGSTLLIVISAVSLITILATVALSMSVANLQMKSIENKSKRNFYNAESVLEEIKAGLSVELFGIIEKTYITTLTNISEESMGKRDLQFKKSVLEEIVRRCATVESLPVSISTVGGDANYDPDFLKGFLSNTVDGTTITSDQGAKLEWSLIPTDAKKQYVCFHDVVIEFTSNEGYMSRIRVDLKVTIPNLNLDMIGSVPNFTEYGIIADDKLVTKAKADVMGSVFAGAGGIYADGFGSKLSIQANQVITKDAIQTKDGGSIMLGGLKADRQLELWATNILTSGSDVMSGYPSSIRVDGNLYIADDTTLNAKNSTVEYAGSYYGFGHGNTPSESSALLVNRQNCTLDLSKITNFVVAGRAFIEPATMFAASNQDYIQTGESISSKAAQSAYRLPSACIGISKGGERISGITNPMPFATYDTIKKNMGDQIVDTSYRLPFNNKELKEYVNEDKPYLTIFDQDGGSTYVYLYPNFKDEDKANEYMQAAIKNEQIMQSVSERINHYETQILLSSGINTAKEKNRITGNIIGIKNGEMKFYSNTMKGSLPTEVVEEADRFRQMYNAYCAKLLPVATNEELKYKTMYEALLIGQSYDEKNPGIKELLAGANKQQEIDETYGGYLIVDGDVTADASLDENIHLIVASGNVTVNKNFRGLIFAKGEVTLGNGITVTADQGAIYDLIKNTKVKSIFRDYNGLGDGLVTKDNEPFDAAKMITYENWTKE